MTVRQAIRLTLYTTRSLKRGETAGYLRLVHAKGKVIRIPSCATQRATDSKAIDVRWTQTLTSEIWWTTFQTETASLARQTARIPRLEAI
jgi:hypothetical protein